MEKDEKLKAVASTVRGTTGLVQCFVNLLTSDFFLTILYEDHTGFWKAPESDVLVRIINRPGSLRRQNCVF
jgi:hypothetical protein